MISVCMATYNGARFIENQLLSIVSNLNSCDEVIISDDGSTDDTLNIINELQKTTSVNIIVVKNEGEHGYTSNFENALKYAKGDYIFLSDQDDFWMVNKFPAMIMALKEQSTVMAICNAKITDEVLKITSDNYFKERGVHKGIIGNIYKFGYLGCCMAFRRSLLRKALPFPKKREYCTHDNWLYLCAATQGRIRVIEEPLVLYRRHSGVVTTGAFNAHKPLSFRIRYRLYLISQLISRLFK